MFVQYLQNRRPSAILSVWLGINGIFPFCFVILFAVARFEPPHQALVAYTVVLVIQIANIAALTRYRNSRRLFSVTIVLNLFALGMLGSVSFVTSIPDIPLVIKSMYLLVLEHI